MIGIAGAGIGGLTLAVALQKKGFDLIVLERQDEVRDGGAGISLWPNSLAALDELGLGDLVRSSGRTMSWAVALKSDGRPGFTWSSESFRRTLGEGLVCIDRGVLVRALADRLAPGTVRVGCAVAGYHRTGTGVAIDLSDGESIRAEGLVGADGFSSAVARGVIGDLAVSYSGYTAWRAIAEIDTDPGGERFGALLHDGYEVGWLPVGAGRTYWFATACQPRTPETGTGGNRGRSEADERGPDDLGVLLATFADRPSPVPELIAATPEDRILRTPILDRTLARRWCDGPVTLLGDAAHPMRPHLGQGGCQAIEDAAVLASCVGTGAGVATAFADYERRRRRRATMVARLSKHAGFTRPPGLATSAFGRITDLLPPMPVGGAMRIAAPIAGYRAGLRAVRGH